MITDDINRCFIVGWWWRTMSRDIVSRNHHARFSQTGRMFSRDSKRDNDGCAMNRTGDRRAKDMRFERRKKRKTHSLNGGHGFRKFATQVDRKIRDEWRSDTMQARCRREQNRRHPPSSFVAATRVSPPKFVRLELFTTASRKKKGRGGI